MAASQGHAKLPREGVQRSNRALETGRRPLGLLSKARRGKPIQTMACWKCMQGRRTGEYFSGGPIKLDLHRASLSASSSPSVKGGDSDTDNDDRNEECVDTNDDTEAGSTGGREKGKADKEYSKSVQMALSALRFYKREISPMLPPSCRFIPSCSSYSMQAFKEFGTAKGFVLTAWRLLRCQPLGGKAGYDPPKWPPVGLERLFE